MSALSPDAFAAAGIAIAMPRTAIAPAVMILNLRMIEDI
jgi:hypothetical protein